MDILNQEDLILSADSPTDVRIIVRNYLSKTVESGDLEKYESLQTEITNSVIMCITSEEGKLPERIDKALYKTQRSDKREHKLPLVLRTEDKLVLRIPDIPDDNQGLMDNLAKIIRFTLDLMGMKKESLKILRDPSLGRNFPMPAKISRNVDILQASLRLPANSAGEAINFESGLKANLPEILAAIRVLRRTSNLTRSVLSPKGRKVTKTTAEMLRRSFNLRFGFEEPGSDSWVTYYLKAVFSEVTKPDFERFPGEWMHSLRVRNNTNSDIGIVAKMGYVATQAAPVKAKKVILSYIEKKTIILPPKGKKNETAIGKGSEAVVDVVRPATIENLPNGISHREFRAALVTLMPFIDPVDQKGIQEQLPSDSLKPITKTTLEFYERNSEIVDALNLSFAIITACEQKSRKATLAQYEQARNHYINSCANVKFQDRNGRQYDHYSEIHPHIRGWFEKTFNRKIAGERKDPSIQEEVSSKSGGLAKESHAKSE
jgi:hypothetical protein